ncbi:hypothetical protein D3C81_240710 [compost metagenome]
MFITNEVNPLEILSQLLTQVSAPAISDEFVDLAHNRDLCPGFKDRLDEILSSYMRHRSTVYDIQGFTDQGADVLLVWDDDSGERRRAALQIKSYAEIKQDLGREVGKRQLINSLKSQFVSAKSKHGLDMFYILLCGDGTATHHDFVRRVCAEFTNLDDVKVITPAQAWSFYSMKAEDISSYCMRVLCKGDPVVREVQEEFASESDAYRYVAISAVVSQLCSASDFDVEDMSHGASMCDELGWEEQIEKAIQSLMWSGDVVSDDGGSFKLRYDAFPTLRALYYDSKVRHGFSDNVMVEHLMSLTSSD